MNPFEELVPEKNRIAPETSKQSNDAFESLIPKPKVGGLQKATNIATSIFPGGKIGEAIGTGIAKIRAKPEEKQYISPGPTGGEIAGDIAMIGVDLFGGKILSTGAKVGGRVLSKIGEKGYKFAIPLSKVEAGIMQSYKAKNPLLTRAIQVLKGTQNLPRTAEQTALEKGFASLSRSGIGVQAKREAEKLWTTKIGKALEASTKQIDMPNFLKETENTLSGVKDLTRRKALLEALQSVKEDYAGIKKINLKQLQAFKEGWAEFLPEKVYQGKSIAGALTEIRNLLSRNARTEIYKSLGKEIQNDYLDYGNLKKLQELGKSAMTGEKLKGGAGSFITEIAQRVTTPITTIGGQALYKTGKVIEKVGKLGQKKIF